MPMGKNLETNTYKCDFHIHSCLSPCGDLFMSPRVIAEELAKRNIKIAALTDHNTSLNCPAFKIACEKLGIFPLFGMEAQSMEEVHCLCLFGDLDTAMDFSSEIYEILPNIKNQPEKTGDQVFVNEEDEILGELEKYLIMSIPLSIDDIEAKVHERGGLFIPAHVDRPAFSMYSQLGYVPKGNYDALEVTRIPPSVQNPLTKEQEPLVTYNYPLITDSDAHYEEHIGRRTTILEIQGEVNFHSIKKALSNKKIQ